MIYLKLNFPYNLKKTKNPKSLLDAVAKDKSGKESASTNDKKDKKTFKKKSDGKPKRKERKAPMTPAERRASKPNFALVINNILKALVYIRDIQCRDPIRRIVT